MQDKRPTTESQLRCESILILREFKFFPMGDDGEILEMHGTFEKFKYNYSEPLGECHQIFAKRNK